MKFHMGALNISELMSRETCEGWFQPFFVLWESHTCFLACTRTCTLVLALRLVEDIAEGKAHTAVRLDFPLHGASTIVHRQILTIGLKQVVGKELGNETSLEKTLVSREAQRSAGLVHVRIAAVSLGLERCIHPNVECL